MDWTAVLSSYYLFSVWWVDLKKIAKLFFSAVPFQIKYIIQKKIYQPLGPQNTPLPPLQNIGWTRPTNGHSVHEMHKGMHK